MLFKSLFVADSFECFFSRAGFCVLKRNSFEDAAHVNLVQFCSAAFREEIT